MNIVFTNSPSAIWVIIETLPWLISQAKLALSFHMVKNTTNKKPSLSVDNESSENE